MQGDQNQHYREDILFSEDIYINLDNKNSSNSDTGSSNKEDAFSPSGRLHLHPVTELPGLTGLPGRFYAYYVPIASS